MKKLFFSLVFIIVSFCIYSQEKFPKSWVGDYEGNLEIYAVDSIGMKLKMKLGIHPTEKDSVFQWIITYDFRGKEDVRSYELKVVNAEKGQYQIDEKNSIVIESYYRYDIFTSYFEVNKSLIITSHRKEGDIIEFEIIASKNEAISRTGNTVFNGEEIPEVITYPVNGRQRCILTKTK